MLQLFAIGSNGSGQLGIGHCEDVSVPKPVLLPESLPSSTAVGRLTAGGNHTLVLTTTGKLVCAGDATIGACGQTSTDSSAAAHCFRDFELDSSFFITHVAATWSATIFAVRNSSTGRSTDVYATGLGERGELGLGAFVMRVPRPERVASFPPEGSEVVDLAASMGHVVAVLSTGEVWGWGAGRKGQLGEPAEAIVAAPRRIAGVDFPVVKAVCGKEFTCLLGEAVDGQILVLGSDKWGVKSAAPAEVTGWKHVGAGWGNVHVLKDDGTVQSWGRDDHGQISLAEQSGVNKIAVGSEHTVALMESGDVVAWGWGEHGNCGPGKPPSEGKGTKNVIASAKYIPEGSRIAAVGAGCATSWVAIDIPS